MTLHIRHGFIINITNASPQKQTERGIIYCSAWQELGRAHGKQKRKCMIWPVQLWQQNDQAWDISTARARVCLLNAYMLFLLRHSWCRQWAKLGVGCWLSHQWCIHLSALQCSAAPSLSSPSSPLGLSLHLASHTLDRGAARLKTDILR